MEYSYELTDRFLNLYRKLENYKSTNAQGYAFYKRKYADELNLFRELRNYLSHEEFHGAYPFAVSEAVTEALEKMLTEMYLTCEKIMNKRISIALLATPLEEVIKTMDDKHYSYVPILDEKKRVNGIISSESIISLLSEKKPFDKSVSEYLALFSLKGQSKKYVFLSRRSSFYEAERLFTSLGDDKKRVGLILITENGNPNEALLGIISPYDVFENN